MTASKKSRSRRPHETSAAAALPPSSDQIQRAIYHISEAAQTAPSLQELYAAIHRIVGELMSARNFYIALHDAASDTISFPYFVDAHDPTPAPKRPGKGLTEYVLRSGEAVLATPDVVAQLERSGEVELIGAPSIDWLGVPLTAGGTTSGVLVVQSYTDGVRYGTKEKEILQFVSTQVAMAIERKRVEAELRESEHWLRQSQRVAGLGSYVLDVRTGMWRSSTVMDEIFGIDGSYTHDVAGWVAVIHPGSRDEMLAYFTQQVLGRRQRFDREYRIVRQSDRQERWVHGFGDLECDDAGNVLRMVGTIQDVTERKRAEDALRTQAAALDAAANSIMIMDREGRIEWCNAALSAISGFSFDELIGMGPQVLRGDDHDPQFAEELWRTLRAGQVWRGVFANRRKGGARYVADTTITPLKDERGDIARFLAVAQDVTERRQLEEQLQQAQKMEAVGRLAGGIAHDFNNLLTAVLSSTEFLLDSLGAEHPGREDAEEIRRAALRAADLTHQLLAYSRRQILTPKVLDLNEAVAETQKLLRRLIGEDVTLSTRLAPALGLVRADPGQLEQVIVNLAVNARDAMPQGGTLAMETANVAAAHVRVPEQVTVAPGGYVMLAMSDTGTGMDADTQAHIFEPFFTTKPQGTGTGLGLATVYGIVKQSNGYIWVESAPGRGTTFRIYLPRVERPNEDARPALPPQPPRGHETVLLVEDDEPVRSVLRRALADHGYLVLEAGGGAEAVRLASLHRGPIHLLVTDVVMPEMDGRELAERMVAARPGLALLLVSGYTDDDVVRHGLIEAGVPFLHKPFAPNALLVKVREVLDQHR